MDEKGRHDGGMIAVACKVKIKEGGNRCFIRTNTSDTRKTEDLSSFMKFPMNTAYIPSFPRLSLLYPTQRIRPPLPLPPFIRQNKTDHTT